MSKANTKSMTPFAKRIAKIINPMMQARWAAPDTTVRYTGTTRCDNNWGTHNLRSLMFFEFPLDDDNGRWVDVQVGCMDYQRDYKGKLRIIQHDGCYLLERVDPL